MVNITITNKTSEIIKKYDNIPESKQVYFNKIYVKTEEKIKDIILDYSNPNALIYVLDLFFGNDLPCIFGDADRVMHAFYYLEPNLSSVALLPSISLHKSPDLLRKLSEQEWPYFISTTNADVKLLRAYYRNLRIDWDNISKNNLEKYAADVCSSYYDTPFKYLVNLEYFCGELYDNDIIVGEQTPCFFEKILNPELGLKIKKFGENKFPILRWLTEYSTRALELYPSVLKCNPKAILSLLKYILENRLFEIIENEQFIKMYDDLYDSDRDKLSKYLANTPNIEFFLLKTKNYGLPNIEIFKKITDKEFATRVLIRNAEMFNMEPIDELKILSPPIKLDNYYKYCEKLLELSNKRNINLSHNLFINCMLFASTSKRKYKLDNIDNIYCLSDFFFEKFRKSDMCNFVSEHKNMDSFVFVKIGCPILTEELFSTNHTVLSQFDYDLDKLDNAETVDAKVEFVGIYQGYLILDDTRKLLVMSNTVISFMYQMDNLYLCYFTDGQEEKIVLILNGIMKIFKSEQMLAYLLNNPIKLLAFLKNKCSLVQTDTIMYVHEPEVKIATKAVQKKKKINYNESSPKKNNSKAIKLTKEQKDALEEDVRKSIRSTFKGPNSLEKISSKLKMEVDAIEAGEKEFPSHLEKYLTPKKKSEKNKKSENLDDEEYDEEYYGEKIEKTVKKAMESSDDEKDKKPIKGKPRKDDSDDEEMSERDSDIESEEEKPIKGKPRKDDSDDEEMSERDPDTSGDEDMPRKQAKKVIPKGSDKKYEDEDCPPEYKQSKKYEDEDCPPKYKQSKKYETDEDD